VGWISNGGHGPLRGRINLGTAFTNSYYGNAYVAINIWKHGGLILVKTDNAGDLLSTTAVGVSGSPWGTYLNTADGELIAGMPANFVWMVRPVAAGNTHFAGETWVIKFTGTCDTLSEEYGTTLSRTGNRATFTWPEIGWLQFKFSNVDRNDPPQNIAIVPLSLESAHDAGELFRPDYLDTIKRGGGRVRFIDSATNNFNTVEYSDIPGTNHYNWGDGDGAILVPNGPKTGVPLAVSVAIANQTKSHLWLCVPQLLGIKKSGRPTALSNANPAVFTDAGHTYVDGDVILIRDNAREYDRTATATFNTTNDTVTLSGGWIPPIGHSVLFSGGTPPSEIVNNNDTPHFIISDGYNAGTSTFKISKRRGGTAINLTGSPSGTTTCRHRIDYQKVTVSNVVAGVSYAVDGFDGTGHATASNPSFYTFRAPVLADLSDDYEAYAQYIFDNLDPNLYVVVEWGNEQWNPGFAQYFFAHMMAMDLFDYGGSMYGQGYYGAHLMKAFSDVYGASNRSRWIGVMGTQTANSALTVAAMDGVQKYIDDNAPSLEISDLVDEIAVTGYFGDEIAIGANLTTLKGWIATSISRHGTGLESNQYAYFDRMWNEECYDGRHLSSLIPITTLPSWWGPHKTLADAAGVALTQYEGQSHAVLLGIWGSLSTEEKAQFLEFWEYANFSEAAGANLLAMYDSFEDYGTFPAQSGDFYKPQQFGAWGPKRNQYDSDNAKWRAVKLYNGRY
jgi:hypothetical protein